MQQVSLPPRDLAQLLEPRVHRVAAALLLELLQPLDLLALGLRVDPEDVLGLDALGDVLVHAHDDVLIGPDTLRVRPRGLLDLAADEIEARDRAAELLDPVDQLLRALLDLVGEGLDEVRARERVDGVDHSRLVGKHLLGAQRHPAARSLGSARASS